MVWYSVSPEYTAQPQALCPMDPQTKALVHKFITLQGCVVILRNTYLSGAGKVRPNHPEVLRGLKKIIVATKETVKRGVARECQSSVQ